jgi:hypothetical protein
MNYTSRYDSPGNHQIEKSVSHLDVDHAEYAIFPNYSVLIDSHDLAGMRAYLEMVSPVFDVYVRAALGNGCENLNHSASHHQSEYEGNSPHQGCLT